VQELKGYKKLMLQPGEQDEVTILLPIGLATSFWDEAQSAWLSESGIYIIEVMGTGEGNRLSAEFEIEVSRHWNGL
jgi:beta-glucosidase